MVHIRKFNAKSHSFQYANRTYSLFEFTDLPKNHDWGGVLVESEKVLTIRLDTKNSEVHVEVFYAKTS